MRLTSIQTLVDAELKSTDQSIMTCLESNLPLIKEVIEYIINCGGKRIRPLILLLSAKALSYQGKQHIELAAVIELIHTATLLHDDVVDHATLRRGHQTAHTIWGKDVSVLMGDFLYSRAFQIVVDFKQSALLDIFAQATHYIAEGELMQLVNCKNPDTTENYYFEIIQRKTAKLFEIAAQLAAVVAKAPDKEILAFSQYGLHLGLAYQLIDDALDYNRSSEQTGKNIGQDIAEGKVTLPLIYAIQQSSGEKHALLKNAIQDDSNTELESIIEIIESTGAIQYTSEAAKRHGQQAKTALAQIASSPYKKALEELCDFVIERRY